MQYRVYCIFSQCWAIKCAPPPPAYTQPTFSLVISACCFDSCCLIELSSASSPERAGTSLACCCGATSVRLSAPSMYSCCLLVSMDFCWPSCGEGSKPSWELGEESLLEIREKPWEGWQVRGRESKTYICNTEFYLSRTSTSHVQWGIMYMWHTLQQTSTDLAH